MTNFVGVIHEKYEELLKVKQETPGISEQEIKDAIFEKVNEDMEDGIKSTVYGMVVNNNFQDSLIVHFT